MIIAIDGACKRNGKPDCIAAGSAYVVESTHDVDNGLLLTHEVGSTNQRGELLGLISALQHSLAEDDVVIITDSEYIFNTITKQWYSNWERKGWLTAAEEPVKNQDLWKRISSLLDQRGALQDISMYHIKGHVMPFGAATAKHLLSVDKTGARLLSSVWTKFNASRDTLEKNLLVAKELFVRNHGYAADVIKFVIYNTVADLAATTYIAEVDVELQERGKI